MIDSSLYDDPELYDLLFTPEPTVVDFYLAQAAQADGELLELACGNGKLLVPVACALQPSDHRSLSSAVTGVDLSRAMLERARVKADAAQVDVDLVHADMRSFELQRQFGLIFVASNSLQHLHDVASLRAFFTAARRHLAPGARLAFDVLNPDVRWLARSAAEKRRIGRIAHSTLGELEVEESSEYDAVTQVSRSRWYFHTERRRNVHKFSLHLRNFFPRELELLLEACDFRLISRFGDFDGSAFSATSPQQVCVCEPHPPK